MRPRRTWSVLAGLVALTSILADTTSYGADSVAVPENTGRYVGGAGVRSEGFLPQQTGRRVEIALAGVDDGVAATATTATVENNEFDVGNVALSSVVGRNDSNNNNDKLVRIEGGGEVRHQVRQNVVLVSTSGSAKRSSTQQGSKVGPESAGASGSTSGLHSVGLVTGEAPAAETSDERVWGAGAAAAIAAASAVGLLATFVGSLDGSSSSAEEGNGGGDIDLGLAAPYGTRGYFEPGRGASRELAWDLQASLREEAARAKGAEAAAARGKGLRGRGIGHESERVDDGRAGVKRRGPERRVLQVRERKKNDRNRTAKKGFFVVLTSRFGENGTAVFRWRCGYRTVGRTSMCHGCSGIKKSEGFLARVSAFHSKRSVRVPFFLAHGTQERIYRIYILCACVSQRLQRICVIFKFVPRGTSCF